MISFRLSISVPCLIEWSVAAVPEYSEMICPPTRDAMSRHQQLGGEVGADFREKNPSRHRHETRWHYVLCRTCVPGRGAGQVRPITA
jgi:hypothetical protein